MDVRMMRAALNEAKAKANTILATAESNGRELSATERADVNALLAEAKAIHGRLERHDSDAQMRAAIDGLGNSRKASRPGEYPGAAPDSIGAQLIASQSFQWLQAQIASGGLPSTPWTSPASEIGATTLTEDPASAGDLVVPHYVPGIVGLPTRRLYMAQLFAPGKTDSNLVVSMKETLFTNNAAAVAELGAKPESALEFDKATDPVKKIAHWMPLSDEILEDVAQVRSYVDARLRSGVNVTLDNQLLNGSGVGESLTGVLNRAGLAAAVARGADTNADAIAKQIGAIATANEIEPDGIVMHPTNWQTIRLTKDGDGNYIAGGGPWAPMRTPTLWGLPVAVTSAIAVNTALVGCFREAGQVFTRSPLRVEISNSHSDFFTTNKVAIRAELRAALAIYRPACFGTVTGLN